MSQDTPDLFEDPALCVEQAISKVGKDIVLGLPIGIGKPTHLVNEIYRRVKEDPGMHLKICTGLTLHTPIPGSDLERRIMEPLVARIFPGYPNPKYFEDAKKRKLPPNVEVKEIYFSPGYALNNDRLQQDYVSANFTYVPRAVMSEGCNLVALSLSKKNGGSPLYSLGGNSDAAIMMVWELLKQKQNGRKKAILGQVNGFMPYTYGTSEVPQSYFTSIVDNKNLYHPLFAPPKEPVTMTDYSIAFHVSSLVKDGGTFQVGFGSLGDAVIYCLQLRHKDNELFRRVISEAKIYDKFGDIIEKEGGKAPFEKGIYGCSEFIFDGFLDLIDDGIIKRKTYDNEEIQKLVCESGPGEKISEKTIDALLNNESISERLTQKDFALLKEYGIFKETVTYENENLIIDGAPVKADLADAGSRAKIISGGLGDALKNGRLIHAGFFLGSQKFYDRMSKLDEAMLRMIQMREISFVNDLVDDTELKKMQRKHGRFVNTAMMATMLGGVVSDTLEDGQVVSGVGGQYNFVSMAHLLPCGRSIIMIRSTRQTSEGPRSNIVWTYGNLTIPRHMRDLFVTEYGIADTRDKSDKDTITALLNIADSRFQPELLKKAKEVGKVPKDYEIPLAFRSNYPEVIDKTAAPFKKVGCFPMFPYGTEFTKEELVLGKALRGLKSKMTLKNFRPSLGDISKTLISPPAAAKPYLERMSLDKPSNSKEKMLQKLVLFALSSDGAI